MASPLDPNFRVSKEAVGRAVDALLKWMRAKAKVKKAQLLEHDDLLYLVLTVKKIPPTGRTNPHRIPIPHPLHSFGHDNPFATSICLLVDDRPKSPLSPSAARNRISSDSLPVSDVIGLSHLRSDYHPFEARRRLCDSHDLFFADRRILPLLPRLLGKHFFKRKKIPLPVDLSRPGWPEQIRQCCVSTLLYLRTGTCSGLKVGRVSQARDDIVENVMAAIAGAMEHVPKKWANVRSLHIKAVESAALPIYQSVPELGLKIEVFQKERDSKEEPFDGEVAQMEEAEKGEMKKKSGGSKNKIPKKKGRIHEVQYIDTDPEYGSGVHDDDAGEEDVELKYNGEEDTGIGEGMNKRMTKKQKMETEAKPEKGKKFRGHVPLFSGKGTPSTDVLVEGDDEKLSDKLREEKRMKKTEKGKYKKDKMYGDEKKEEGDDGPEDDVQEGRGSDEYGASKRMLKTKIEKDTIVKKEKVKKDKDAKKIKRSKVRHVVKF